jgi:branched-chain amino acid transport system substrate-binding protein
MVHLSSRRSLGGILVAVALAALTATACGSSSSPTGAGTSRSPIVLGDIATLSGPNVIIPSPSVKPTLQAWVDYVNAHGGIHGHPVELIVKDDHGSAAQAVADLNQLIDYDHIVALVGVDDTGVEASWENIIDEHKIPVIGLPYDIFWETDPNYFPVTTTATAATIAQDYLGKVAGGTVIGTSYCVEVAICKEGIPIEIAGAKAAGIPWGGAVAVSSTAPNYAAQCLALKDDHINVVISALVAPVRFFGQCATQGYTPQVLVSGAVVEDPGFFTSDAVNNHFWVSIWEFPPEVNASQAPPAFKTYKDAMAEYAPSTKPDFNSTAEWTSGLLFQAAAEAVHGAITSASLIASLRSMTDQTLGGLAPGPLNFSNPTFHPVNCSFVGRVLNHQIVATQGLKPLCIDPSLYQELNLK